MKIIYIILNLTQPFAVIVFLIAGICSLILKKYHQGAINIAIATANFFIFYGGRLFLK